MDNNFIENSKKYLAIILIVYSINIFDAVATYYGVKSGWIQEANPIMIEIVKYPLLLIIIKVILPLFLLGSLALLFYNIPKYSRFLFKSLRLVFWVYLGILVLHINWIYALF